MPNSLCTFLVTATKRAADDLVAAFEQLPEDKRNWSPMGDARTAMDQLAECAILTGGTADLAVEKTWKGSMDEYMEEKQALVAKGFDETRARLQQSVDKLTGVLEQVNEEELRDEIQMPWGSMTLEQIISYPYWNCRYHEGQINYIASMLGCLK